MMLVGCDGAQRSRHVDRMVSRYAVFAETILVVCVLLQGLIEDFLQLFQR